MLARVITGVTVAAAWTTYLTHALIAAYTPVGPLPHGLRNALPATLLAVTLLLAPYVLGPWLFPRSAAAHGLNVRPRWDEPEPEPGCRNTPPPEPDPLAVRIVRPARAVGRAAVDDSPTLDLLAGVRPIHPAVLEAGQRIAAALRRD